jgi:hypothetical protein
MKRIGTALLMMVLVCATTALAQQKKSDTGTRSVEGVVTTANDTPAVGAVVQLENTKTQQIRSYITKDDGTYHFYELSTEVDYRLKADHNGASSGSKTLSSFDGRKKATINLKVNAR